MAFQSSKCKVVALLVRLIKTTSELTLHDTPPAIACRGGGPSRAGARAAPLHGLALD